MAVYNNALLRQKQLFWDNQVILSLYKILFSALQRLILLRIFLTFWLFTGQILFKKQELQKVLIVSSSAYYQNHPAKCFQIQQKRYLRFSNFFKIFNFTVIRILRTICQPFFIKKNHYKKQTAEGKSWLKEIHGWNAFPDI